MTPDKKAVERVKRNLFGAPTEVEKKQFNQQYEETFKEERKVNHHYRVNSPLYLQNFMEKRLS